MFVSNVKVTLFRALVVVFLSGCSTGPALKQPSDSFTIENPSVVTAVAIAVYDCMERGYETADVVKSQGGMTTFVCKGVYTEAE